MNFLHCGEPNSKSFFHRSRNTFSSWPRRVWLPLKSASSSGILMASLKFVSSLVTRFWEFWRPKDWLPTCQKIFTIWSRKPWLFASILNVIARTKMPSSDLFWSNPGSDVWLVTTRLRLFCPPLGVTIPPLLQLLCHKFGVLTNKMTWLWKPGDISVVSETERLRSTRRSFEAEKVFAENKGCDIRENVAVITLYQTSKSTVVVICSYTTFGNCQTSSQYKNDENLLYTVTVRKLQKFTHVFNQKFVKTTVLWEKLLKSRYHEIFFQWVNSSFFLRCSHTCLIEITREINTSTNQNM